MRDIFKDSINLNDLTVYFQVPLLHCMCVHISTKREKVEIETLPYKLFPLTAHTISRVTAIQHFQTSYRFKLQASKHKSLEIGELQTAIGKPLKSNDNITGLQWTRNLPSILTRYPADTIPSSWFTLMSIIMFIFQFLLIYCNFPYSYLLGFRHFPNYHHALFLCYF